MEKSSSREGFWGGGGIPGRASSIKRDMEAGKPGLSRERTSGLDWLEHGVRGCQEHGFVSYISWVWAQGEELWKKESECENFRILEA